MTKTKVEATSSNRYQISRLTIVPSLAGASHIFPFEGKQVEIRLPDKPPKPRGSLDSWGTDRIACHGWYSKSGRPVCYNVSSVDVLVGLRTGATIPSAALGKVNVSLFSARQQRQLDRLASVGESTASRALDRWIRILRWRTLYSEIGQRAVKERSSGWSTHLIDRKSQNRFYAATQVFVVPADNTVSKRAWTAAEGSLTEGVAPPVWFDFLFEGEHRIASGDRHGGIISLAIACETLLRALFAQHATNPRNEEFLALLNTVPIGRILGKRKQLGFSTPPGNGRSILGKSSA